MAMQISELGVLVSTSCVDARFCGSKVTSLSNQMPAPMPAGAPHGRGCERCGVPANRQARAVCPLQCTPLAAAMRRCFQAGTARQPTQNEGASDEGAREVAGTAAAAATLGAAAIVAVGWQAWRRCRSLRRICIAIRPPGLLLVCLLLRGRSATAAWRAAAAARVP